MSFLETKKVESKPTYAQVVINGLQVQTQKDSTFKESKLPLEALSDGSSHSFSKNEKKDSKTVYNFSCQQYCKFESSDEESDIDHFEVPPILSKMGCHIVTI